ncbi:DUF5107 domain-containing protein [Diplocloster agilis]|uniref:DUF5107 domain-containing protein n=1 Tax=Diplocloster agilis TaxID=2850323 RepID=A0A949K2D9_9FIRM|nr:DUF5107 domain-containing protein [Diplocloster agilis]MBU9738444.1 DUF5107 domain-containing protein [Diplocloster agilis]
MDVWEKKVQVWEQDIEIPTYEVGKPDKNPMFLEKRVYQGSSGKVYPHSVIDKIYDEKVNKTYHAVYLENKYLKIMVLPELGGRIQRATDKTNNYDFVYYNHVIKPALVGLTGPWISGGIEFNWPQHHRPSTFDPVDFRIMENSDGSCTVLVGEIENMFRTKGMAAFTLHPDKAYLEISAQLYNRTNRPQTFLWWANPAVPVNDHTQSIFPPDVHAVMDHGKRDVSNFPIATGVYYKMDYSEGVDISRYKNIPVPTSYMADHSDYDFVGGYDYQEKAGILHVADHHVAPGKKQWTWGCGEFGKAWDRNLTDEDGPYVELMTGCFTDNQPDFTWMAPYEEKVFTQYFMPYKGVGQIKNATVQAAVGLEEDEEGITIRAYVTGEYPKAEIRLTRDEEILFSKALDLSPEQAFEAKIGKDADPVEDETRLEVTVLDQDGNRLVAYRPEKQTIHKTPDPASPVPLPEEVKTNEDLYLYGLHLEQYRHATYEPADYYLEGLRRDPTDSRINTAYGKLLMSRGRFAESVPFFEAAISKLTRSNPNPYDGEAYFQLGLALRYMGKDAEAYDRFYKAAWSAAWQDAAYYQMACICTAGDDLETALSHVERSLVRNYHNMKARNLKASLLRKLEKWEACGNLLKENEQIDPLDLGTVYEEALLQDKIQNSDVPCGKDLLQEAVRRLRGNFNTAIELAIDKVEAGLYREAAEWLELFISGEMQKGKKEDEIYPLVYYYVAGCYGKLNQSKAQETALRRAASADSSYCFPHRLEDIGILTGAIAKNPEDSRAAYYLGNLWYDKKQYGDAISCFERSAAICDDFATVHRNLALACYNKLHDAKRARTELEKAFQLDTTDARVFMELDQLRKKMGMSKEERLKELQNHMELVEIRDDLYLEYATLLNACGRFEEALQYISRRNFHPWEGGEGKVPAQYLFSLVETGKKYLRQGDCEAAIKVLKQAAGSYPYNLGEGKLAGAQENNIYYYLGCAYEGADQPDKAAVCFQKAAVGISEPAGMMYYNDQPPEMIFYQGMALRKLNREKEARSRFHKLLDYGQKHIFDDVKIDYFAVSLPDLQIFDEDLNRKNEIHCRFLMGLGLLGLGQEKEAGAEFQKVLALDGMHVGALIHSSWS